MDKEKTEFQQTESTLVAYFLDLIKRQSLSASIARVDNQIKRVLASITDMQIPLPTITANYQGVNVTGGEIMSNTERMLLAQEERLLDELADLKVKKSQTEQRLRKLEDRWEAMDALIAEALDAEEYFIAEMKYTNWRISLQQIANSLKHSGPNKGVSYSKSTIAAKRERLVAKMAEALRKEG